MVSLYERGIHNIKYDVRLTLFVSQHSRDIFLFNRIQNFFNTGSVIKFSGRNAIDYKVRAFNEIYSKFIPFFIKYPILGIKSLDFKDFCKVANLMKNKIHLTKEGAKKIKEIQSGMNSKRIY
jgi:hypothetical protein